MQVLPMCITGSILEINVIIAKTDESNSGVNLVDILYGEKINK